MIHMTEGGRWKVEPRPGGGEGRGGSRYDHIWRGDSRSVPTTSGEDYHAVAPPSSYGPAAGKPRATASPQPLPPPGLVPPVREGAPSTPGNGQAQGPGRGRGGARRGRGRGAGRGDGGRGGTPRRPQSARPPATPTAATPHRAPPHASAVPITPGTPVTPFTPAQHGRARAAPTPTPGRAKRQRFAEHWDPAVAASALQRGEVFRGIMRINAFKRSEAYITLPGVSRDILIACNYDQNRAVEGDEVAVQLFAQHLWQCEGNGGNSVAVTPATPAAAPIDQLENDSMASSSLADALAERLTLQQPTTPATPAVGQQQSVAGDPTAEVWRAPAGTAAGPTAALAAVSAQMNHTGLRVTCRVVAVLAPSPRRENIVGSLKPENNVGHYWAFQPVDPRMPRLMVDSTQLPDAVRKAYQEGTLGSLLVGGRLVKWEPTSMAPLARLDRVLGQAGEINAESEAIAFEFSLPPDDFEPEVLACLPSTPWAIPQAERELRRPLQETRIFSIDPPTARDLDDALSVRALPGGGYELGVHIADVAHFIPPQCALDQEARVRSTSTYLTQKVVPMLPRLLCEELCSLNPGVERLAFSAIWELTDDGEVRTEWFGRSIIRSCAKLDYAAAQRMIETTGTSAGAEEWAVEALALHGGYEWHQVAHDVRLLHTLSQRIRQRRFALGSLRLDNTKILFRMDGDGNPCEALPYITKDSNHLVEEFMLLANRRVAKFIADVFPQRAVLRRHPPPDARKLDGLRKFCEQHGLQLDLSSAGALHASLQLVRDAALAAGDPGLAEVVTLQVTKPMQLAMYFCTADVPEAEWRHYALAFPYYTHFTSPIRRYPDVLVHRLLAAALDAQAAVAKAVGIDDDDRGSVVPSPEERPAEWGAAAAAAAEAHALADPDSVSVTTAHANERKLAAKNAQDASSKLFLAVMLRSHPAHTTATVSAVGAKYLVAYLPEFGMEVRVSMERLGPGLTASYQKNADSVTVRAGGGGGGSNGFGKRRQRRPQRRERADAAAAVARGDDESESPAEAADGEGEEDRSKEGKRTRHGRLALPAVIRPLSSVPVRLTSLFEPGKRPEVVASLHLDLPGEPEQDEEPVAAVAVENLTLSVGMAAALDNLQD